MNRERRPARIEEVLDRRNTEGKPRSIAQRVLAVLGSFSHKQSVQTLSEIQHAAGLPSATTHRIVSELVEWGALERVSWGRYRIGMRQVLLAFSRPGMIEQVIAGGLPRMARNTITDPDQLRRVLDTICTTGYCLSRDDMTDGASSVAAAVRGATGAVIAAISVVVPTGQRDLLSLVPAVRTAAAGISRGMVPFTFPP